MKGLYAAFNKEKNKLNAQEKVEAGKSRPDLPTYTLSQVKEHNKIENGVWVVYKNGVYDITQFIESHPGGSEKIILAAGSSIEPFWSIYAIHHKNEVYEILETLRIGNLSPSDIEAENKSNDKKDAFRNDPKRNPLLKVITEKPFNAETPSELNDNLVTPNELHFKRNHLPVPIVDVKEFKLEILTTIDGNQKVLTMDDLKTKFTIYTIPGKRLKIIL